MQDGLYYMASGNCKYKLSRLGNRYILQGSSRNIKLYKPRTESN